MVHMLNNDENNITVKKLNTSDIKRMNVCMYGMIIKCKKDKSL